MACSTERSSDAFPSSFRVAKKRTENIGLVAVRQSADKEPFIVNPFYSRVIEFALATVALEDNFAETFKESRGKVDPDLKLGF